MIGVTVQVNGVVQGVGFRPTVWRIARELELTGSVRNGADGVTIELWGDRTTIDHFVDRLRHEPPPLARIEQIETRPLDGNPATDFVIVQSQGGHVTTAVAADAATCPDCLTDIHTPENHRYHYPFTNCTHCGPRLSIIQRIPYDRPNTAMAPFTMCPQCQREYEDPADRRFHAQPNCCPVCGPQLWLEDQDQHRLAGDPIAQTARLIKAGKIVAIKGIGGFHIACDATNENVVLALRQRKQRPTKALAVMVKDMEQISSYARVTPIEAEALQSRTAPIVILPIAGEPLAPSIAPLQQSIGFMLPYSPLHHLLMASLHNPIVLTSGNRSGQPQCIHHDDARKDLSAIVDYWLFHDREIINRVDDSVMRLAAEEMRTLRYGRGLAPRSRPLPDGFDHAPPILAMGGELKNSLALLHDGKVTLSQYLGDLDEQRTLQEYEHAHQLFQRLYDHHPEAIAVDQHPNYLSTQLGTTWAQKHSLRLIPVQHHHAHIAAVMAEHRLPLDTPPLLGIALDGLGFGDGEIWGGEFLLSQYHSYRRVGRFTPIALPGGDRANREPWRNTVAHLIASIGLERLQADNPDLELTEFLTCKPLTTIQQMVKQQINSPPASSCGRLIDAVAAAIGLQREQLSFEGEAAIALEALAATLPNEPGYPAAITEHDGLLELQWQPLWGEILHDLHQKADHARIASRFHQGLSDAVCKAAIHLCEAHQIDTVALGGGVFQNRLLLEEITRQLTRQGLSVLSPVIIPANDQGIALGQCVIAAATIRQQHP